MLSCAALTLSGSVECIHSLRTLLHQIMLQEQGEFFRCPVAKDNNAHSNKQTGQEMKLANSNMNTNIAREEQSYTDIYTPMAWYRCTHEPQKVQVVVVSFFWEIGPSWPAVMFWRKISVCKVKSIAYHKYRQVFLFMLLRSVAKNCQPALRVHANSPPQERPCLPPW